MLIFSDMDNFFNLNHNAQRVADIYQLKRIKCIIFIILAKDKKNKF